MLAQKQPSIQRVRNSSLVEKFARENNGVATAVAMATYAYFAEQPELLADNTKIVYVSFGAENSGHSGSGASNLHYR